MADSLISTQTVKGFRDYLPDAMMAREALMDTHAELATDLVGILAPRMPFDEAIERYLETMQLEGEEKEAIGTRAPADSHAPRSVGFIRFPPAWHTPAAASRQDDYAEREVWDLCET
mgnify:CR=1 FL=1